MNHKSKTNKRYQKFKKGRNTRILLKKIIKLLEKNQKEKKMKTDKLLKPENK